MVQWLRTTENAPSKTLCELKGRLVSPGKPTNQKPSLDTACAVHDELVNLICKRRDHVED